MFEQCNHDDADYDATGIKIHYTKKLTPTLFGKHKPRTDRYKFCMPGAVQDIITPANFGEDRLRSFGVARCRILAFSTDLLRRL